MRTIGDQIGQIREMEGRAAVQRTLASLLRLRYLGRDSTSAAAKIVSADGAPVAESTIEAVARELEDEAADIDRATKAARTTRVSDE